MEGNNGRPDLITIIKALNGLEQAAGADILTWTDRETGRHEFKAENTWYWNDNKFNF